MQQYRVLQCLGTVVNIRQKENNNHIFDRELFDGSVILSKWRDAFADVICSLIHQFNTFIRTNSLILAKFINACTISTIWSTDKMLVKALFSLANHYIYMTLMSKYGERYASILLTIKWLHADTMLIWNHEITHSSDLIVAGILRDCSLHMDYSQIFTVAEPETITVETSMICKMNIISHHTRISYTGKVMDQV